ncbi:MAG: sigma-70 family RNA polymerase sigma factor, partial [Verrucomicrobiota bacterium]
TRDTTLAMNEADTNDFYETYREQLVGYARGFVYNVHSAEDIVQEAFARFTSKHTSRSIDSPVAFLYRIVRNLALDHCRRSQFERKVFSDAETAGSEFASSHINPAQSAIHREELLSLRSALSELPERTRIAVEMHRWGGCKLREIAQHLNISTSLAQILVRDGVAHCYRRLHH